ncbi:MAG: hypothetical protein ISS36_00210 [Candidatus Aenigmarchaeota archaeon]|nr:hypothetical protein [Candidatus Aenigmarchaeota archaeon]
MVNKKFERIIDAKLWKTGNAIVVTIPSSIIKKFKMNEGDIIEVRIKR